MTVGELKAILLQDNPPDDMVVTIVLDDERVFLTSKDGTGVEPSDGDTKAEFIIGGTKEIRQYDSAYELPDDYPALDASTLFGL